MMAGSPPLLGLELNVIAGYRDRRRRVDMGEVVEKDDVGPGLEILARRVAHPQIDEEPGLLRPHLERKRDLIDQDLPRFVQGRGFQPGFRHPTNADDPRDSWGRRPRLPSETGCGRGPESEAEETLGG